MSKHCIITIGRSFGAGGREVGQALAQRLDIAYYDKELLVEAAKHSGLNPGIFQKNDERAPGFLSGTLLLSMGYSAQAWYSGPSAASGDSIYAAQCDFIRDLAQRCPCVIVGRTADYVLRDNANAVSVFLHATEDSCIDRIMRRNASLDREAARSELRRTNKCRADYYNFYTDRIWGNAASYDLCINTTNLSTEAVVELIVSFIESKK